MRNIQTYEDWGVSTARADQTMPVPLPRVPRANCWTNVSEAYSGAAIVSWYGNIERQIQNLIQTYQSGRNFSYADKLRQFLNTWRNNQISGSINRETLDPLEASSAQLAVDGWKLNNYFSNLRDALRRLIASEEELPRMPQQDPMQPAAGGAGAPPPSNDFGAQEEEPQPGSPDEVGSPEEGQPTGGPEANAPGAPAPGTPGAPPAATPNGAPPQGQPTAA